ncbi:hypothetical protein LE181_23595 [Streptomyces sp. SCA3-4]|uniref:hypothetical protein n=1 Tax=Streptomyces sichuanensis TaxID=2871810 RepID=UPI001CE23679|nr:hypothetical protein [Streptomyces sichuanensis]MCA6095140.1 hypothetical protein [Streptomyces sichuanensis]
MAVDPGPLVPDYFGDKFEDPAKQHSDYSKKINDLSFTVNKVGLTVNGMTATLSTMSGSVTALSGSVEGLKVSLGLVAMGVTPIKFDAAALKVDEKGIVFAGKQKWTWPHARDAKQKQEAADKKASKTHGRVEKAKETATASVERARLNPRDAEAARKARQDIAAFKTAYRNARSDIERAKRMRAEADEAEKATKKSREKIQRDMQDYSRAAQNLNRTVDRLSRSLAGG